MGTRFTIVIAVAVAATGVMALGAQPAAAVKYDTEVTITQDRGPPHTVIHGHVESKANACEARRVFVFKRRNGPDRKLGSVRTRGSGSVWWMPEPRAKRGWHVYAEVRRKVLPHRLCRPARSETYRVSR